MPPIWAWWKGTCIMAVVSEDGLNTKRTLATSPGTRRNNGPGPAAAVFLVDFMAQIQECIWWNHGGGSFNFSLVKQSSNPQCFYVTADHPYSSASSSSGRGSTPTAASTPVTGSTGLCETDLFSPRWYQYTLRSSSRNGTHGPVSTVDRARSVSTCASSGGTRKPPRKIWPVLSMVKWTCWRRLPLRCKRMKHSVQNRSTQSSHKTEAL